MKKKGGKYLEFNFFERKTLLILIDNIIVLYCVTSLIDDGVPISEKIHYFKSMVPYMYSVILFVVLSPFLGFYDSNYIFREKKIFPIALTLGVIYSVIYLLTPFLTPRLEFGKSQMVFFVFSVPFLLSLWRVFFAKFITNTNFYKNVLLITEDNFPYKNKELMYLIEGKNKKNGLIIKNTLNISHVQEHQINRIKKYVDGFAYNTIIMAINDHESINGQINKFLIECIKKDLPIFSFYTIYENIYEAMPLKLAINRFYDVFPISRSNYNYLYKFFSKSLDITFVIFVGLFFMILIPIIWFLNLFFNKGPLFYTQYRVGKGVKEYKIYKFRSMVVDAEKNGGAVMATKNDSRITSFGKILRKSRIDELPQILSLIRGNMSLIGPRPERKIFVDKLISINSFYEARYSVKPGITGWAQVNYKYGENLEDSIKKLEYDLYYIKNRSIFLDIRILFKTVHTVLFSKGQ